MPTTVPPVLSPYLSEPSPGGLLLITSVLGATANWLLVRSISAALYGDQSHNAQVGGQDGKTQTPAGRKAVFLSLLRPLSFWNEIGKKAGLDISILIAKHQLVFVDGLDIYQKPVPPGAAHSTSTLASHAFEELRTTLQRAVQTNYHSTGASTATVLSGNEDATTTEDPILILDGLDFLIASQPECTATALLQMLTAIRERVHSTILTGSADGPLLHSSSAPATPLEKEHRAFVGSLAHQSRLVMQLRGLDTGTAKDVSGVIRISHGGTYEDDAEAGDQPEGEWLYKVSGDGAVRVWGRGE